MGLVNIKTIVALNPLKVRAVRLGFEGSQPIVEKSAEWPYTEETLQAIFSDIRKQFKTSTIRIVLPESKTYLKLLQFIAGEANRTSVFAKLCEEVPEEITRECFDWKRVKKTEKTELVQTIALSKHLLHVIGEASHKAKLHIEAMEPVSFALARLAKTEKEPQLVFYHGDEMVLAVTYEGEVFESITLDSLDQKEEKIKELTVFVNKKWDLAVAKLFDQKLDPAVGLALKDDIRGSDENTLNLLPLLLKDEHVEEQVEDRQRSPMGKYILLALVVIAVACIPIVLAYRIMYPSSGAKVEPTPTAFDAAPIPTPTPAEAPVATGSATLQKDTLTILLSNGSGIAGEAQKAKTLLEGLGYANITLANADSFDYQETVVAAKEEQQEFIDAIVSDLSSVYVATASNLPLDKDGTDDVTIILGSLLK